MLSNPAITEASIYSASVTGTVLDVTTNANSLIYTIHMLNTTGAAAYLQVFNKQSGNVTLGTTVADYVFGLSANGMASIVLPKPKRHTVGFSVAGTTTSTGLTGAAIQTTITYASEA
jgi:hypothetical protein